MMTPHEYALARGWDFSAIEATAKHGVAYEDLEGLDAAGITEQEMHDWCIAQVQQTAD